MSRKRWLLINPNSNADTTEMMLEAARSEIMQQGLQIDIVGATARTGPALLLTESDLVTGAESVRKIVDTSVAQWHPDALIVAAFADPGIEYAELALPGRTVGIGSSALLEAAQSRCDLSIAASCLRCRKFAVVTTTPELVEAIERRVIALDLQAQWRGVFLCEGSVAELMNDSGELVIALKKATARAVQAGAEAVVVGGGPLSAAADSLFRFAEQQNIVLVAPVAAAVRACIRLSGANTSEG